MGKYINKYGKLCYSGVNPDTKFSRLEFHEVEAFESYDEDSQFALHTNLGSITVLNRMTGFGYRDIETGYRSKDGEFWLATGGYDIREADCKTMQEAIDWVKERANTCIGVETGL